MSDVERRLAEVQDLLRQACVQLLDIDGGADDEDMLETLSTIRKAQRIVRQSMTILEGGGR